jgi:choline kinase
MLSSVYTIGPRVFGTFGNGRVEEFFDSQALTPSDLRDPQISRWIARRMRELHRVDIQIVSGEEWNDHDVLAVRRNVRDWLAPAVEVLDLLTAHDDIADENENHHHHPWCRVKQDIDLDRFYREWDAYVAWLKDWEKHHTISPRVFAHNDAQYGNLLRLAHPKEVIPNHHRIIVVDFGTVTLNLSLSLDLCLTCYHPFIYIY